MSYAQEIRDAIRQVEWVLEHTQARGGLGVIAYLQVEEQKIAIHEAHLAILREALPFAESSCLFEDAVELQLARALMVGVKPFDDEDDSNR